MSENNSHPGVDHAWVCRTAQGYLGEVQIVKPISQDVAEVVRLDPTKAEEFCPGGQIVCNSCDFPLIEGQEASFRSMDIAGIREHLVGSEPLSSPSE